MALLPVYCTVEDVKRALDSKESARNDAQLYRAVDSASRLTERDTHRWFYPTTATRYFEWPTVASPTPWKLWLDQHEIVSLTSVTAGGTAIPTASLYLEPINDGPPYNSLEIVRSSSYAFSAGTTPQRSIAVTGVFGYCNDVESVGTLAIAVSSTTDTTVVVVNSSFIGTGDTIKVDSERMLVTKRTFISTGQTVQTPLAANVSDATVVVTSGGAFAIGEVLLVDSERMLIVDISGNNVFVKRAYDGTTLATHTGSTVYAPWQLTVVRGITGTTAATHLISSVVYRQVVPAPIRDLTIAYALDRFLQEGSGYARTVGSGEASRPAPGRALGLLRSEVIATFGRGRIAAV